ncbi:MULTISPECIES: signal peptidase I [Gordonia]|uniref:signal peptidase I n=1 Tax=Gordonia TaxID=2053 RepID=UPI0032649375
MTAPATPDSVAEADPPVPRTPRQRALHLLWQGASWLLLAAAFAVLVGTIVVPKVAGARPYTVLTPSMKPDYPPGTLIVVKPRPIDSIAVGDVITYQIASGRPDVITHRVTEIQRAADGAPRFVTRGDNNGMADPVPVRPVQVRGVLWYSVPYLGFVNTWFTGAKRTVTVFVLAGLLFAYGAWQFYADWRAERRRRRAEEAAAGPADDTPTTPLTEIPVDTAPIPRASIGHRRPAPQEDPQ